MFRSKRLELLAAVAVIACTTPAVAQVPGWVKFIRWISGDNDRTDVPITPMGDHMQMSRKAPSRSGDAERADEIVAAAREVLRRHPDEASERHDGYRPFHETGAIGEEVHYTSIGYGYAEGRRADYLHPGSLLFRRTRDGLVPVGVMYSAPGRATAAELDARAPLSIATWHRHVDFCWPAGPAAKAEAVDPRFGYAGTIHTQSQCAAAGGYWLPLAFGWMTHVYPNDRARVWGGEEMGMAQADMHR